ncbi:MAG: hypothetical protein LBG43_01125 [Treponema sp.]|nr:hypothetical protein [Treponema sp.]
MGVFMETRVNVGATGDRPIPRAVHLALKHKNAVSFPAETSFMQKRNSEISGAFFVVAVRKMQHNAQFSRFD